MENSKQQVRTFKYISLLWLLIALFTIGFLSGLCFGVLLFLYTDTHTP